MCMCVHTVYIYYTDLIIGCSQPLGYLYLFHDTQVGIFPEKFSIKYVFLRISQFRKSSNYMPNGKKFVWYNSCFNTRAKMMLHISNIHYKTSAYNTLIYMYTLYYFWQSFFMYMNWPVTSGVEAGYVWNVSDQGIL